MLVEMASLLHGVTVSGESIKGLIGPTHLYHLNILRVANIGNVMLQCCFFPINEILKQFSVCLQKS